jgi:hypothetical protein
LELGDIEITNYTNLSMRCLFISYSIADELISKKGFTESLEPLSDFEKWNNS